MRKQGPPRKMGVTGGSYSFRGSHHSVYLEKCHQGGRDEPDSRKCLLRQKLVELSVVTSKLKYTENISL